MVSGLVTSPCDQLRIFSGEARLIRMASKSAIGLAMSKGLERYKVVLRFPAVVRRRTRLPKTSFELPVVRPGFPSHLWPVGWGAASRRLTFPKLLRRQHSAISLKAEC